MYIKSFMATATDGKTIKNIYVLKALFDQLQTEKKSKERVVVKLSQKTSLGSSLFCLESLIGN